MSPLRNYSTIFLAGLLLFSNFAGWMHVGCANHGDSSNSSTGKSCCCSHHHCHAPQPLADETPTNDAGPVDQKHDPEQCAICQNFLAAQANDAQFDLDVVWESLLSEPFCVGPEHFLVEACLFRGLSVRGPPRA